MGWTRRANPKWQRKASRQRYPSIHFMSMSIDRHGNAILNRWDESWVGSSRWYQRYTARQQRAAAKLQIAYELYEDAEWQRELLEQWIDENWYDDEPMDPEHEDELAELMEEMFWKEHELDDDLDYYPEDDYWFP